MIPIVSDRSIVVRTTTIGESEFIGESLVREFQERIGIGRFSI